MIFYMVSLNYISMLEVSKLQEIMFTKALLLKERCNEKGIKEWT